MEPRASLKNVGSRASRRAGVQAPPTRSGIAGAMPDQWLPPILIAIAGAMALRRFALDGLPPSGFADGSPSGCASAARCALAKASRELRTVA